MDHSLRTISYIADIGDIVVIMARRRTMVTQSDIEMRRKRQSKILCHVFESEEVSDLENVECDLDIVKCDLGIVW